MRPFANLTFYQILEVSPLSSPEVIKRAFHTQARSHHPDKNPGDLQADAKMKVINAAYEILGDTAERKRYDLELAQRFCRAEGTGTDVKNQNMPPPRYQQNDAPAQSVPRYTFPFRHFQRQRARDEHDRAARRRERDDRGRAPWRKKPQEKSKAAEKEKPDLGEQQMKLERKRKIKRAYVERKARELALRRKREQAVAREQPTAEEQVWNELQNSQSVALAEIARMEIKIKSIEAAIRIEEGKKAEADAPFLESYAFFGVAALGTSEKTITEDSSDPLQERIRALKTSKWMRDEMLLEHNRLCQKQRANPFRFLEAVGAEQRLWIARRKVVMPLRTDKKMQDCDGRTNGGRWSVNTVGQRTARNGMSGAEEPPIGRMEPAYPIPTAYRSPSSTFSNQQTFPRSSLGAGRHSLHMQVTELPCESCGQVRTVFLCEKCKALNCSPCGRAPTRSTCVW